LVFVVCGCTYAMTLGFLTTNYKPQTTNRF